MPSVTRPAGDRMRRRRWSVAAGSGQRAVGRRAGCDTGAMGSATDQQALVRCVERVAAGDRDAFSELYDEFGGVVYSIAMGMLRNHASAEDAAQDVWVKIWNAAATYDGSRAAVSTWIVVITRRHVLDLLRREKVRAAGRPGVDPETDVKALAVSSGDDVAGEAELAELGEEVRAALRQLPHEQRRALVLAYYGGRSQSEIAAELGKPLGTVKTYMFQGLKRLRANLDSEP